MNTTRDGEPHTTSSARQRYGQARQRVPRVYARVLALTLAFLAALARRPQPRLLRSSTVRSHTRRQHSPCGSLMDAAGNLYGTTLLGGKYHSCHDSGGYGCGTVFKLDANGVETVLHSFNGSDGAGSSATLIMNANGDLYGTAAVGGGRGCNTGGSVGCGVAFRLSGHKETVLYRFTGGADGAFPWAGLVADAGGNFYGTTNAGGKYGGGVVFKLVGTQETVQHAFTGGKDGNYLAAGSLLMDAMGNLYGTDAFGGDIDCDYPNGCGVVFKLTGKQLTVLHSFKGPPDGQSPIAGLIMDARGNLYGTTYDGGTSGNGGTVFEVEASRKERVLHRFHPYTRGGFSPSTALVQDANGNLYGTTESGVAYEITVDGKEKVLHIFCTGDCSDGGYPNELIIDSKGNLYGTAYGGGINGNGTVFMITP